MKKTLVILSILLITFLSFLLFHDKGNLYLKPYVASYLETQLKQNMSVEVQHLKIDFNYVEVVATLNELTQIKAQGEVLVLAQTLDIDYTLKSDGFKTFDNKVDINGTVMGSFDDLNITGEGETLKSHIHYTLNVKNDEINNINVNINQADIASLLELAAQPAYAEGKVDVYINIPTLKDKQNQGKAKIVLHQTTLNEKIVNKELEIDLPKKTVITANINSKISANAFNLEGDIKSNLASIKLSNASYKLESKEFLTNYVLSVPELSKLMFISKQKLNGTLQVHGKFLANNKAYNLQGKTKSLEGETNFNFNGKKLSLTMQNVEITKLLHLVNRKNYASGKLMANIKLNDVKNLTGNFKINTKNAKTTHHILKKELALDFGKPVSFSLNSEGEIISNIAKIENTLDSDIFNYRSNNMQYDVKKAQLSSTYVLNIPKLSKLNSLTNNTLSGSLKMNGELNYDNKLQITGETKSLGGEINFKLSNEKVTSTINNVSVEKLMDFLNYPRIFKASLVGDFKYDLNKEQGTFTSKLNQAQLLSNQLTVIVQQIRAVDLTKERYNETEFNAILEKNLININFKAKSKTVLLEIPSGKINKATNQINATYLINIENKDLKGRIQGDIAKPKISFDSSSFLQEKVIDALKGKMPEDTLRGLSTMQPEAIKNTVENLLGNFFN